MTQVAKPLDCFQIQYDVLNPVHHTTAFVIGERIATYTLLIYTPSLEEAEREVERQKNELPKRHNGNNITFITELRHASVRNKTPRYEPTIEIKEHIIEVGSLVVIKPEQWNWIVREIHSDSQMALLEDERGMTTQAKLNRLSLLPWKGGWFEKDGKRYFQMPPYPGVDY